MRYGDRRSFAFIVTPHRRDTADPVLATAPGDTRSRRPHGSMNFRSFAAVNGLRPPEAARVTRAIDSLKTSETGGFHDVDGALCRTATRDPAARRARFPYPLAGEGGCAERGRMRGRGARRAVDGIIGSRGRRRAIPAQRRRADERASRRDPSSGRRCRPPSPARGKGGRALVNSSPSCGLERRPASNVNEP